MLLTDAVLTGTPGGRIFQFYLMVFAPRTTYDRAKKAIKDKDDNLFNALLVSSKLPFYNFLLASLFNLNRSADKQLLLRNLLADSKGMSKTGRVLFSKLGLLLSERTFQRRLNDMDELHSSSITYSHSLVFSLPVSASVNVTSLLFCFQSLHDIMQW